MSEDRSGQQPEDTDLEELDDELDLVDEDDPGDEELGEMDGPQEERPAAEPAPEPRRQTREERRIQALRQREREAREETRRLRDQNALLLSQTRQPQVQVDPYRQAEYERQEQERLALMPPHEVSAYYANRSEQRMTQQLARINVEHADRLDRIAFSQIVAGEPAAKRLEKEVEATLAEARQQGMNPSRQVVYELLIGREYRERANRQVATQRRTGQRRVAAQQTRAGSPRNGAAPAPRGRRDDADSGLDARLRSVTVGDAWNSNW